MSYFLLDLEGLTKKRSVFKLNGNGTTASSDRGSSETQLVIANTSGSTTLELAIIANIFNYSNTTTFKTILSRSGNAGASTTAAVSLRRDTSAITTISFDLTGASTYSVGSTFTLYGIKAA